MRRILFTFAVSFCTLSFSASVNAQEQPPAPPTPESSSTAAPPPTPAADAPAPAPAAAPVATAASTIRIPDLTGDWCGSWQSCVNGHKGPMRASFCRLCDGNYQVTFTGRFCKLIPFRYKTTLNVTGCSDGVIYLSGSHNLGPILGTFTYNAWANDRQFASGYNAGSKDQGQFNLSR